MRKTVTRNTTDARRYTMSHAAEASVGMAGTTLWLTGLAGAGKTTVGALVCANLRNQGIRHVAMLDGDVLRGIFNRVHSGMARHERLELGLTYGRLCRVLNGQGIHVVCCTIAMFKECHTWNRKNLPLYLEVYLKVPLEVLRDRDHKGLYSGFSKSTVNQVVGLDLPCDEPENPDLLLVNDGSRPPEDVAADIAAKFFETI